MKGRVPDKKWTTQSGVVEGNFCNLQRVALVCLVRTPISLLESTRDGIPDRRTGLPYNFSNWMDDIGLAW